MAGGVVWGIGARAAMRVVALVANHQPEFSWEGSLVALAALVVGGAGMANARIDVRYVVDDHGRRTARNGHRSEATFGDHRVGRDPWRQPSHVS